MKKEDKEELKWRLASKPTLENIEKLLNLELISKDEAREMLFSKVNTNEENKALKEQVDFLKDVIEKMSKQSAGVVWNHINTYQPVYRWTVGPTTLCSAIGIWASAASSGTGGTLTSGSSVGYTLKGNTGSTNLNNKLT